MWMQRGWTIKSRLAINAQDQLSRWDGDEIQQPNLPEGAEAQNHFFFGEGQSIDSLEGGLSATHQGLVRLLVLPSMQQHGGAVHVRPVVHHLTGGGPGMGGSEGSHGWPTTMRTYKNYLAIPTHFFSR